MNPSTTSYAALSIKGDASTSGHTGLTLQGVQVNGRLDGLLLRTTLQQRYRNLTGRLIETVYTFPLAHGATLLGVQVTLGEQRLKGTVFEKRHAVRRYEQAIESGDMPVLVEQSAPGLYTANVGNLKHGEEAVIELEYAQLLRFEQGGLRLSIPTVVAPRYGNAHAQGGLAPHESTEADWAARYPFTLALDLTGPAAQARLSSPSHPIAVQPLPLDGGVPGTGEAVRVTLGQGAWLDRDFVLRIDGLEGQSFCVTAPDGDDSHPQAQTVLASFCPRLPAQPHAPLTLKILVDGSGSMGGDSIEQARRALHEVGQWLEPADRIAYFRFGSTCVPVMPELQPCTPSTVGRFARAVNQTMADLGGTELHSALLTVFGQSSITRADVLLITDGEVWAIEPTVQAARASGHRLFVVGVSSSPAESLLRELAEQSGGACEMVTPNEDIAGAITRMVRRLRAARDISLRIDWNQAVQWQSPLPPQVFDGETLHVWARLEQPLQAAPTLHWRADGASGQDSAHQVQPDVSGTTARLCGARRADTLSHDDDKLALALRYQLVTPQTSLFLVHTRAEGEQAQGLPALEPIRHMMAAGHGGFGSVANNPRMVAAAMMGNSPVVMMSMPHPDHYSSFEDVPTFLRRPSGASSMADSMPQPAGRLRRWMDSLRSSFGTPEDAAEQAMQEAQREAELQAMRQAQLEAMQAEQEAIKAQHTLRQQAQQQASHSLMLAAFEREARTPERAWQYLDQLRTHTTDPALQDLLDRLTPLVGQRLAAALLLYHVHQRLGTGSALSRQSERLLHMVLNTLDPVLRAQAEQLMQTPSFKGLEIPGF